MVSRMAAPATLCLPATCTLPTTLVGLWTQPVSPVRCPFLLSSDEMDMHLTQWAHDCWPTPSAAV